MNEHARRPPLTGWGSRWNFVRACIALAQGMGAIGLAALLDGCSTRILKEALGRMQLMPWDLSCANDGSLRRRGFDLPLLLDPAKAVTRSAFFRLTPAPTVLRVQYEVADAAKSLGVGLSPLSQMHVVDDAAAR